MKCKLWTIENHKIIKYKLQIKLNLKITDVLTSIIRIFILYKYKINSKIGKYNLPLLHHKLQEVNLEYDQYYDSTSHQQLKLMHIVL